MTTAAITDGTLQDIGPKLAAYQHPVYATYLPIWKQLAHVREGAGGFLDGTYLVAHPREWRDHTAEFPQVPTKKLLTRRRLACYENFAATIIEAKKSALFREAPIRRLDGPSLQGTAVQREGTIQSWWEGAFGGEDLSAQLAQVWDAAATFGHVYLYLERPAERPGTIAEASAPYICAYTPLDVPDWTTDSRGRLTGVKFIEPVPRVGFEEPVRNGDYQYRVVDEVGWTVYNSSGQAVDSAAHGMGRLPVVVLYVQRRPITPHIGQSVLQDPRLHIDLFNLLSELRELLRNQTFSILNVPLGTGPDAMGVDTAKTLLDQQTGTENVLFSGLAADFIAADASNVKAYQEEIERRLRTIYRLAAIQWEADTRGVEARGSLALKREDMNQRLSLYADELEATEYTLAELWYRAMYGADQGLRRFEADEVFIQYPDTFDVTPFDAVLAQAQAAISLDMPMTFMKALRKSLVPKFLPSLGRVDVEAIYTDIDAAEEPDPLDLAGSLTSAQDQTPPEAVDDGDPTPGD